MTLDERIEALTQTVELMAATVNRDHNDRIDRLESLAANTDRYLANIDRYLDKVTLIMEDHERRLNELEDER